MTCTGPPTTVAHGTTAAVPGTLTSLLINAAGEALAGTSRGILKTTDDGTTWSATNASPLSASGDPLWVVALTINSAGDIFAATEQGVFRSVDGGSTWTLLDAGLATQILGWPVIHALVVDADGYLYAGTEGRGVFRSEESTTAGR